MVLTIVLESIVTRGDDNYWFAFFMFRLISLGARHAKDRHFSVGKHLIDELETVGLVVVGSVVVAPYIYVCTGGVHEEQQRN